MSRMFAGFVVVALVALAAPVWADVSSEKIMSEIRSAVNGGLDESKGSTDALMHTLKRTDRGMQEEEAPSGQQKPYPWWALPPLSYDGPNPAWSRAGLNEAINERVADANTRLEQAYGNYTEEYCTDYGPIVNSEWVPAKFNGGGCKLVINLGGCYVYPVDGPDKKTPVSFAVNCTTPAIGYEKVKPRFESPFKSPTLYSFQECRGKSLNLGQEKTNYLQTPGQQFTIPLVSMPVPPKLAQWVGL